MAQGTYLVVQGLRACLLMLKTQVQSLVREQIPHAAGQLSLHTTATEPWHSRALTTQLEKTVSCKEEAEHHNKRSCATTKTPCSQSKFF